MQPYEESYVPWWQVLLLMPTLLVVTLLVLGLTGGIKVDPNDMTGFTIGLVISIFVMGGLSGVFWRYRVECNDEHITFGFSFWQVHLYFDEIESVEESHLKPMQYGGYGWKLARKKIAYVNKNGPAVMLSTKAGRNYIFNCDDAENVVARMVQHGVEKGASDHDQREIDG